MQTFHLKHKNIIRTRTNFKQFNIIHHSVVVLLQSFEIRWRVRVRLGSKFFCNFFAFFNYFFDFYYMVIEGPLAPNFFYEYLILASTIFPRENYKKLGLTPRECPLSVFLVSLNQCSEKNDKSVKKIDSCQII